MARSSIRSGEHDPPGQRCVRPVNLAVHEIADAAEKQAGGCRRRNDVGEMENVEPTLRCKARQSDNHAEQSAVKRHAACQGDDPARAASPSRPEKRERNSPGARRRQRQYITRTSGCRSSRAASYGHALPVSASPARPGPIPSQKKSRTNASQTERADRDRVERHGSAPYHRPGKQRSMFPGPAFPGGDARELADLSLGCTLGAIAAIVDRLRAEPGRKPTAGIRMAERCLVDQMRLDEKAGLQQDLISVFKNRFDDRPGTFDPSSGDDRDIGVAVRRAFGARDCRTEAALSQRSANLTLRRTSRLRRADRTTSSSITPHLWIRVSAVIVASPARVSDAPVRSRL